jgi:hypothetical protein
MSSAVNTRVGRVKGNPCHKNLTLTLIALLLLSIYLPELLFLCPVFGQKRDFYSNISALKRLTVRCHFDTLRNQELRNVTSHVRSLPSTAELWHSSARK